MRMAAAFSRRCVRASTVTAVSLPWYWNRWGSPVPLVVLVLGGAVRPLGIKCSPILGGTPVGHWLLGCRRPGTAATQLGRRTRSRQAGAGEDRRTGCRCATSISAGLKRALNAQRGTQGAPRRGTTPRHHQKTERKKTWPGAEPQHTRSCRTWCRTLATQRARPRAPNRPCACPPRRMAA